MLALLCVATEASSGGLTLTHELELDGRRVRAGAGPVTASWSTPINTGNMRTTRKQTQFTVLGDTSRGKVNFARELRLSGCVSKTAGAVSYDISRRLRSGLEPPPEPLPACALACPPAHSHTRPWPFARNT